MILKWLTLNAKEGQDGKICLKVPEKQTVYKTQVAMRQGGIFIRKTREAPELIGKAMHCWRKRSQLLYASTQRSPKRCFTGRCCEQFNRR